MNKLEFWCLFFNLFIEMNKIYKKILEVIQVVSFLWLKGQTLWDLMGLDITLRMLDGSL